MKKLTAILLIALFIFNLFGYRILFYSIQQQSDINIENSLDNNQYNEQDLVTISIPISIPYQSARTDFERYSGEIEFNGKIYKYVKRKVSDGNLVLLCLPDNNKMRLENAKNDVFKIANDLNTASGKLNHTKKPVEKTITNDYNQNNCEYLISQNNIFNKAIYFSAASSLAPAYSRSIERPPDVS